MMTPTVALTRLSYYTKRLAKLEKEEELYTKKISASQEDIIHIGPRKWRQTQYYKKLTKLEEGIAHTKYSIAYIEDSRISKNAGNLLRKITGAKVQESETKKLDKEYGVGSDGDVKKALKKRREAKWDKEDGVEPDEEKLDEAIEKSKKAKEKKAKKPKADITAKEKHETNKKTHEYMKDSGNDTNADKVDAVLGDKKPDTTPLSKASVKQLKKIRKVDTAILNELEEIKENQIDEQDTTIKKKSPLVGQIPTMGKGAGTMTAAKTNSAGLATLLAGLGIAAYAYKWLNDNMPDWLKNNLPSIMDMDVEDAKDAAFATTKTVGAAVKTLSLAKHVVTTSTNKVVQKAVQKVKKKIAVNKFVAKENKNAIKIAKELTRKKLQKDGTKVLTKGAQSEVAERAAKIAARKASVEVSGEVFKRIGKETTEQMADRIGKKLLAQSLAKSAGKKIPLAGLGIATGLAYIQWQDGEYGYAVGEVVSGILAIFPGAGTAGSVLIDLVMIFFQVKDIIDGIEAREKAEDYKRIGRKMEIDKAVARKIKNNPDILSDKTAQAELEKTTTAISSFIKGGGDTKSEEYKTLTTTLKQKIKNITSGSGARRKQLEESVAKEYDKAHPELSPTKVSEHNGAGSFMVNAGNGKDGRFVNYPDGSSKLGGHRNWRNNNPGNLTYNDYTKGLGAIGTDGRFAIFASMKDGYAAQEHMLTKGKNYKGKTLSEAIYRYAPPSENDTERYIAAVTAATGISRNAIMGSLTDKESKSLVLAMSKYEGMKAGRITAAKSAPSSSKSGTTVRMASNKMMNSALGAFGLPKSFKENDGASGATHKFAGTGTGNGKFTGKPLDGLDSKTMGALNKLSSQTGELNIVSAFRDAAYNKKVGGKTNSYHKKGMAVDITWTGNSRAEQEEFIRQSVAAGFSGIGVYANFIHVDTGPRRAWGANGSRTTLPEWARLAITDAWENPNASKTRYAAVNKGAPLENESPNNGADTVKKGDSIIPTVDKSKKETVVASSSKNLVDTKGAYDKAPTVTMASNDSSTTILNQNASINSADTKDDNWLNSFEGKHIFL